MRYVYIKDGNIVDGPRVLPVSWENVSNFNLLEPSVLKTYGWYPHRFVEATVDDTVIITGSYFVIGDDEVVEYQTVRAKTEIELNVDIEQKWINIRSQRNIYLNETDWTQMNDSPLSQTKKEEWKLYRQSLRDITKFDNPDHVIWPEKPLSNDPPVEEVIISTELVQEQQTDSGVINE